MIHEKTIYEARTPYNDLRITENGQVRILWSNGIKQSALDLRDRRRPCFEYIRHMLFAMASHPDPRRILVIGLGGGTLPTLLAHYLPEAYIDCVEIDPEMPNIARTFFPFSESEKVRVIVDDAYRYVHETNQPYDIVFLDAFIGSSFPEKLGSKAFLYALRKGLKPGGLCLVNHFTGNFFALKQFCARICSVFPFCYAIPGIRSDNMIFMLSGEKIEPGEWHKKGVAFYTTDIHYFPAQRITDSMFRLMSLRVGSFAVFHPVVQYWYCRYVHRNGTPFREKKRARKRYPLVRSGVAKPWI